MKGERPTPSARRFLVVGVALIAAAHLYALFAFGATYWVDSRSYAALAEGLRSPGRLAEFYDQGGRWLFSHLQPGLPALWLALDVLPQSWRWPALALLQHAVAAAALSYAYVSVNRFYPSRFHLLPLLVLLFLPGYQALHNALLTESATSSLLLVAFAACLHVALSNRMPARHFIVAIMALVLVAQFRSYWAVGVAIMLALSLFWRRDLLSAWTGLLGLAMLLAVAAFPGYRAVLTGQWFLPEGGMNRLISGLSVNPTPSSAVRGVFAEVDLPPYWPPGGLIDTGLDARSAIDLARHWRANGLDDSAINLRAEGLAELLREDGAEVRLRRLLYGCASLGSARVFELVGTEREVFRDMSAGRMAVHQLRYYRWQSWVSQDEYGRAFARFFVTGTPEYPFEAEANAGVRGTLEPYIVRVEILPRDPFGLGQTPPDVWLLCGLAGAILLVRRAPLVSLLCGAAMVLAFAMAYWFPLGNTRYAIPLLPLYLMVASIAAVARRGAELNNGIAAVRPEKLKSVARRSCRARQGPD